jgi:hypothetical protein
MELREPLRDDYRRPIIVSCPGCGEDRPLRTALLEADEAIAYEARNRLETAVIIDEGYAGPPGIDYASFAQLFPWVCCTTCGYDGHYVIGTGDHR